MALITKNKPVQPTAPIRHGFFGVPFFKAHLMVDQRWEPNCLTNQFKCMAEVMEKHFQYKRLENAAFKKKYLRQNRNLKQQCRDGIVKLQNALHTTNSKKIRNYLMNYKDMQRLYHAMPVHLVVDNINQRTFVLRKERDRLKNKLKLLEIVYKDKLVEKSVLENRIKYQNEFILEEEFISKRMRNKIECSNVRLNAIKTINDAYKKIIHLLLHDEIYYEPILRSLQKDIEDQAQFANYIIELGLPAIVKLKEITEQHRKLEDKVRRNIIAKLQWLQNYKKEQELRQTNLRKLQASKGDEPIHYFKRYVRETPSMLELKGELEAIEVTIKRVKFATLCSKATEVYPRIKRQIECNIRLRRVLDGDAVKHKYIEKQLARADVKRGILEHNLSSEELARLRTIRDLKTQIEKAKEQEEETIDYLRQRADVFLLLRFVLWDYNDILRHVLRNTKPLTRSYPNADLKLPLLKFENLTMKAYPPEAYEESIETLLQNFKKKVVAVMAVIREDPIDQEGEKIEKEYHTLFFNRLDEEDWSEKESEGEDEDETNERKGMQTVPTRKQLKHISAKMVEELSKKED